MLCRVLIYIWFCTLLFNISLARTENIDLPKIESWTGRWFPEDAKPSVPHVLKDDRVPMGVADSNCDDAKTNLTIDWDGSPEFFTCMTPRLRYIPDDSIPPLYQTEHIPLSYMAPHYCMDTKITYSSTIPTFGSHRPLWPKYGEYEYVPPQRWIHNIEHGGIVALYHPCVDLSQLKQFKRIVKSCLWRHAITPYISTTRKRPFVLVAWGARLSMSVVSEAHMKMFITKHALHGPEKQSKDGQYDLALLEPARYVSDTEDTELCPLS